MMRSALFKILAVVTVGIIVCLCLAFVGLFFNRGLGGDLAAVDEVFNEADFPLEIELSNTVFKVGDKISCVASITNKSGKDVTVMSNGQPFCINLYSVTDTRDHSHIAMAVLQTLKAGDKVAGDFLYEIKEPGTYILYIHYRMGINGHGISGEKNIDIEVK